MPNQPWVDLFSTPAGKWKPNRILVAGRVTMGGAESGNFAADRGDRAGSRRGSAGVRAAWRERARMRRCRPESRRCRAARPRSRFVSRKRTARPCALESIGGARGHPEPAAALRRCGAGGCFARPPAALARQTKTPAGTSGGGGVVRRCGRVRSSRRLRRQAPCPSAVRCRRCRPSARASRCRRRSPWSRSAARSSGSPPT